MLSTVVWNILGTVEDVQYSGGQHETFGVLNISHITDDIPTCIMISPTVLNTPHGIFQRFQKQPLVKSVCQAISANLATSKTFGKHDI